ncbi:MAG: nicotinate phosphoribosyltransferase [Peptostreptococcaceae bacterium]|nr:nicotinate phosphoribosyltransferase [Peptostreptococcaceae bacterium]
MDLTMMTDLYQLTMANGYFLKGYKEEKMIFDLFFRKNPSNGGYTIISGIDQVIDYIEDLSFGDDDIEYLRSLDLFDEGFLDYLKEFKFTGDIYAVEEGTILFPNEPILRVKANSIEAQIIETAMLNILNFQSLIATKASRICQVAGEDPVMEFGLRRAQGAYAGIYGARAAFIGGCVGTSNVLTGKMFDIPVMGTHSHSWVQKFDSELEAFRAYAELYPTKVLLLIDTYNTLKSGLPNAIRVFDELREKGHSPLGVRLDSGDLEYLSKMVRERLDAAGYPDAKIVASNDLDEYSIMDLKLQGAKIETWGIGTKLITSSDYPSLGGVYKLSGIEKDGEIVPKIKISESPEKINNPGYKQILRISDNKTGIFEADLIILEGEEIDTSKPLTIFHPTYTWKTHTFTDYSVEPLLKPLFINGKLARKKKTVQEYRDYANAQKARMWQQYKRLTNPEPFKVDLSQKLWDLKNELIKKAKQKY